MMGCVRTNAYQPLSSGSGPRGGLVAPVVKDRIEYVLWKLVTGVVLSAFVARYFDGQRRLSEMQVFNVVVRSNWSAWKRLESEIRVIKD